MTRTPWDRKDDDLDEEIRAHLALAAQDRVDNGESRDAAERAARREFGNVLLIKEATREIWGWSSIERLAQDVRYAWRALRQSPGFALTATLSLALGIGANTAAFSLADAVLLRPLPIARPAEVLAISGTSTQSAAEGVSYPDFRDIAEQTRAFDRVVAFTIRRLAVARPSDAVPQTKMGMVVSRGFFEALGVEPAAGRAFTEVESTVPGEGAVVVLSHDFWVSSFGGDARVLGSTLRINGAPFTIVGIAPERFTGMNQFMRPAFYLPLTMVERASAPATTTAPAASATSASAAASATSASAAATSAATRAAAAAAAATGAAASTPTPAPAPADSLLEQRGDRAFTVRGRLKPGVTLAAAQAELRLLGSALARTYPDTNAGRTFSVRTELQTRVLESPANAVVAAMLIVLAAAVLAIACANVAGLLLARARARSREIAIRLAIGAGRARVFQQLVTESLVLALCGGAAGVAVAAGAIRYLASIQLPTDTPIVLAAQLDARVLLFSLGASIVSALLFGLAPAWRTVQTELTSALKSSDSDRAAAAGGGGGRRSFLARLPLALAGRQVLVAAQVALSLVLLVVAVTLVDAFRKMLFLDPGVRTDHLMMLELDPALVGYGADQTRTFYDVLADRVRALPGVRSATLAAGLPFRPNFLDEAIVPEGVTLPLNQQTVTVASNIVDSGFFDTMGTGITRGRPFTAQDTAGSRRVAIVNEEFARRFWPGQEAQVVGKRFRLGAEGPFVEIVGVTPTGKYLSLAETPTPYFYLPRTQRERSRMTLVVQTAGDPAAMAAPLMDAVRAVDPDQPVGNVRAFQRYYEGGALGVPLLVMQMVGTMGLAGMTLALIGLYGLVAYSISRRTREIGIRMAIGATRGQVVRLVLRQASLLALAGVAVGALLSVPVLRGLGAGLAGLGGANPWTIVIAAAVLIIVTMSACAVPAWRTAQIDPTRALRQD